MEECDGTRGESRIDGCTSSGTNRNLAWSAVSARPFYTPGRICCFCVPGQLMGFGVGNGMDLGTPRSRPGLACVSHRGCGPDVGYRFVLGAQAAKWSLVVTKRRLSASLSDHSHAQRGAGH